MAHVLKENASSSWVCIDQIIIPFVHEKKR